MCEEGVGDFNFDFGYYLLEKDTNDTEFVKENYFISLVSFFNNETISIDLNVFP